MIKGYRTQATSTATINTSTGWSMLDVPSGKTFVLTDLILAATWGIDTAVTNLSNPIIGLHDAGSASDGVDLAGTAASIIQIQSHVIPANIASAVVTVYRQSTIMHFTNGPEFSYGITPQVTKDDDTYFATGALWISGIIR